MAAKPLFPTGNEEMVVSRKQPDPDDGGWFLTMALGAILSNSLYAVELLPAAKSFLVGWVVAFFVGYWIPPRPARFVPWMLERMGFILCFYLAVFKIPWLLRRAMPIPLARGIPIVVFVAALVVWVRHRKSSFEKGTAMGPSHEVVP